MCISDNPASRNFRKDTELWITQGLHYLKSLVTSQAAPGTEVSVLSLDPVGGKSVGEGRRQGRCQLKKKKKSFKQYWQVSTHKVTGKTAPKEKSILPPPKFTVWACKVIVGKQIEKDHSSGLPEGSGCGPWSQAKFMVKIFMEKTKQNKTHSHTQMANEGCTQDSLSLRSWKQGQHGELFHSPASGTHSPFPLRRKKMVSSNVMRAVSGQVLVIRKWEKMYRDGPSEIEMWKVE